MQRVFQSSVLAALMAVSAFAAIKVKPAAERKKAPEFELKDKDGQVVRLSDYAGKVVLIDFWATWCGPCRAAMPWMNELSEKYKADGLTVLGISMDEEGWTAVKPFMEKLKITYPIVLGTKRVGYLYGDVDGLPVAFFVDRNQRVAAIHLGAAGRKEYEKILKDLLESPKLSGAVSQ